MQPESRLIELLGKTCTTSDEDALALRLLTEPLDLPLLVRRLSASKVGRQFDVHLGRLLAPGSSRLQQIRAALYERDRRLPNFERHRAEMRGGLVRAAAIVAEAGLPLMAVKGSSLFVLLPDYTDRALSDLDLMVPGPEALWKAVRALLSEGYALDESENMWLQNFAAAGPDDLQAHVTLLDTRGGPGLDLHSLSMSFGLTGMLRCSIWQRARRAMVDGAPVMVPSPEDAWLFLITHAYNHAYFTMKDFNDAYALLQAYGDHFDWDYTCRQVAANHLEPCAAYMFAGLARHYRYGPVPTLGRNFGAPGLNGKLLDRNAPLRRTHPNWLDVAVPALITGQYEAAAGGAGRGLRFGLRTVAKYRGDLLLTREQLPGRLERRLRRRQPRPYFRPAPAYGVQVLLTDIDPALSARIREIPWDQQRWFRRLADTVPVRELPGAGALLVADGGEELVVTPMGVLASTVSMLFTEAELAAQGALALRIVEALEAAQTIAGAGAGG